MPECRWTLDDDLGDTYDTDCGQAFTMIAGSLSENGMRFCCYCGKPLREVLPQSKEEVMCDAGDRAYHESVEDSQ